MLYPPFLKLSTSLRYVVWHLAGKSSEMNHMLQLRLSVHCISPAVAKPAWMAEQHVTIRPDSTCLRDAMINRLCLRGRDWGVDEEKVILDFTHSVVAWFCYENIAASCEAVDGFFFFFRYFMLRRIWILIWMFSTVSRINVYKIDFEGHIEQDS